MMLSIFRTSILGLLLSCFISTAYSHETDETHVELNLNEEGFLLHGYDPVSYFDGEPKQGDYSYKVNYAGMNIKFASDKNRERFLESPKKYLPAYGGYCAFGVRMGSKFDIDPEAYEIVDGQLYVLLNRATEEMWLEDTDRNIEIANGLWASIRHIASDKL